MILGLIIFFILILPAAIGTFRSPVKKQKSVGNVERNIMDSAEQNFVQTEVEKLLEHYKTAELSTQTEELLAKKVSFSQEDLRVVQNAAENRKISYAYDGLMDVETAYEKYKALPAYKGTEYPIFENNQVSKEVLYKKVLENNAEFFANKDRYELVYELEDEQIRWACEIICKTVNEVLGNSNYDISREDISTLLWNLCIVKDGMGTGNAYIDKNGKMVLMPTNMETMEGIAMDENASSEIISHETFHLLQRASGDRAEALGVESVYGFSYEFPKGELKVNSLDNTWIVEGTAELFAADLWEMEPTTYKSKISYLKTLEYVHALGGSYEADEMETLILQPSVEKVFKTFGCGTWEEQMELLKVLYTINVIQEEPEDFMKIWEESLGHECSEEELVELKLQLKNSVCQYFTKVFYQNLARQMAEKDVSVEDIFELISTYESDMNVHLVYTDETRHDAFADFFDYYILLQDSLWEQMADKLGVTAAEVINAYNEFNGKMEIQMKPTLFISDSPERTFDVIRIPWMDTEFEKLVNEKHEESSIKKTVSIREYLELIKSEKGVKMKE